MPIPAGRGVKFSRAHIGSEVKQALLFEKRSKNFYE
jgi:hypothetical protein